jgi:hypothetical protein
MPPIQLVVVRVSRNKIDGRPHQEQRNWLEIVPRNSFVRISNQLFQIALSDRLGIVKPFEYFCPISEQNVGTLDHVTLAAHLDSCHHCGTPIYDMRHESVVNAIVATFKYNSLIVESNPKDLPLPGKQRRGPDFVVWGAV